MDNLKPCPFCGGAAKYVDLTIPDLVDETQIFGRVECMKCGCRTQYRLLVGPHNTIGSTKEEIIDIWNNRIPSEPNKPFDHLSYLKGYNDASERALKSLEKLSNKLTELGRSTGELKNVVCKKEKTE